MLYRLREGGFQAFLVGGCVRDLLIGIEPKDFDVATDALPEDVKKLFRNCRLIGRRFRLAHVFFGRETIEVATFRAAAAPEPGDEAVSGRRRRARLRSPPTTSKRTSPPISAKTMMSVTRAMTKKRAVSPKTMRAKAGAGRQRPPWRRCVDRCRHAARRRDRTR